MINSSFVLKEKERKGKKTGTCYHNSSFVIKEKGKREEEKKKGNAISHCIFWNYPQSAPVLSLSPQLISVVSAWIKNK